jgi:hypothetical protein
LLIPINNHILPFAIYPHGNMRKPDTPHPSAGLCSLQNLPEPYQFAFRQGSAHQLPGQFLPAEVDWFLQLFMLPFWLIYALPILTLPLVLVQSPESYGRFVQIARQQSLGETALMMGLFGLVGVLLVYGAWIAWDGGSSFVRTWQAHQLQRRHEHGFGLVLLEGGLVARLIDNLDERHNCLWLPREAIANIVWHRIREEGAKHSRWVYRTHLCYLTAHRGKPQKRWLTLKGHWVKMDSVDDSRRDRALFDQLYAWWQADDHHQEITQ